MSARAALMRLLTSVTDMDRARTLVDLHHAEVLAAQTSATVVYRAGFEHESIPLGLYSSLAAARAHCEAQLSDEYAASISILFDWIGDDSGPEEPWELVVQIDGGDEQPTGYVVTPLIVAAAYDPEAEG